MNQCMILAAFLFDRHRSRSMMSVVELGSPWPVGTHWIDETAEVTPGQHAIIRRWEQQR